MKNLKLLSSLLFLFAYFLAGQGIDRGKYVNRLKRGLQSITGNRGGTKLAETRKLRKKRYSMKDNSEESDEFKAEMKFLQKWNPLMTNKDSSPYRLFRGNVLDAILEQMNGDSKFLNSTVIDLKNTSGGILAQVGFHFRKSERSPIAHMKFLVSRGHLSSLKVDRKYFKVIETAGKIRASSNQTSTAKTAQQGNIFPQPQQHLGKNLTSSQVEKQPQNQPQVYEQHQNQSQENNKYQNQYKVQEQYQNHPQVYDRNQNQSQVGGKYQNQPQVNDQYQNQPQVNDLYQNYPQVQDQYQNPPQVYDQNQNQSQVGNQYQNQPQVNDQYQNHPQIQDQSRNHPQVYDQNQNQSQVGGQYQNQPQVNNQNQTQPQIQDQFQSQPQYGTQFLSQKQNKGQMIAQQNPQNTGPSSAGGQSHTLGQDQLGTQNNIPLTGQTAAVAQSQLQAQQQPGIQAEMENPYQLQYQLAHKPQNSEQLQAKTNPANDAHATTHTQENSQVQTSSQNSQIPATKDESVFVKMHQDWYPFLSNHNSPQYKMLTGNLEKGLKAATDGNDGIVDIKVKNLMEAEAGMTTVEFSVKYIASKRNPAAQLKNVVKSGDISGIPVDSNYFELKDDEQAYPL